MSAATNAAHAASTTTAATAAAAAAAVPRIITQSLDRHASSASSSRANSNTEHHVDRPTDHSPITHQSTTRDHVGDGAPPLLLLLRSRVAQAPAALRLDRTSAFSVVVVALRNAQAVCRRVRHWCAAVPAVDNSRSSSSESSSSLLLLLLLLLLSSSSMMILSSESSKSPSSMVMLLSSESSLPSSSHSTSADALE
jgi:hypothetical protein